MIRNVVLGGDTKAVLLSAGIMFLWALLLGVWKYREMTTSESGNAHFYIDTAHRAALLYSFALLLIATFVQLSGWSAAVNMIAAGAMIFYFYAAVASYAAHGWKKDTDNQLRDAIPGTHAMMLSLIAAEIGGWLVLVAGFADKQIL